MIITLRSTLLLVAVFASLPVGEAGAMQLFYSIQPCRVIDTRCDAVERIGPTPPVGTILHPAQACPPGAEHPQAVPFTQDTHPLDPTSAYTEQVQLDVRSECGLPPSAASIAYNLTVVSTEPPPLPIAHNGFVWLFPWQDPPPAKAVSMLNFPDTHAVFGNGGIVGLSAAGHLGVVVKGTQPQDVDVVLDITGYFE